MTSAATTEAATTEALRRWQRWLLPAMLGAEDLQTDEYGGQDLPRSLRDWIVDFALFGFALIVGAAGVFSDRPTAPLGWVAMDILLLFPAVAALWLRRRYPRSVGWLTVTLSALSSGAVGAAIVGVFNSSIRCQPRSTLRLLGAAVVAAAINAWIYPRASGYNLSGFAMCSVIMLAAVAFGSFVRVRRELVLSLHERARRLQSEQGLRVSEAQLAERARIAREMHDVLAHRISLLSVHAGALEFNPNASPEEIAAAAAVIRVNARAAQEELRDVIGVLRTGADQLDPTAASEVQPPQPTIGELSRLMDDSRAAGMDVNLSVSIEADSVAPTVGRTIYRLVQEALTNVRKHAPGQIVRVELKSEPPNIVQVDVTNRPPVGQSVAPAAGLESGADTHVGSGTGLVGLRERVELAGGTLDAGPLAQGGFRVSARLPSERTTLDTKRSDDDG